MVMIILMANIQLRKSQCTCTLYVGNKITIAVQDTNIKDD